jgi:hypothetical protein
MDNTKYLSLSEHTERHSKPVSRWPPQDLLDTNCPPLNNLAKTVTSISYRTQSMSAAKNNRFMLFGEVITVYFENHTNPINTLYE